MLHQLQSQQRVRTVREGAPVVVGAHIPEEVEGELASLLLAVQLVTLLSLPQLVSKGVAQLVLTHVLLQAMQALDDLGICLEAGPLGPLVAARLTTALLLYLLYVITGNGMYAWYRQVLMAQLLPSLALLVCHHKQWHVRLVHASPDGAAAALLLCLMSVTTGNGIHA